MRQQEGRGELECEQERQYATAVAATNHGRTGAAQVDEHGAPVLDWGHIVEALHKVDAGVPEQVGPPYPFPPL